MVEHTAKIVPGRQKAVIPKIKSGQELLVDPPHLQAVAQSDTGLTVADDIAIAAAPVPSLEAVGAPAADLSQPELETLAAAPQETAQDLHAIALAKVGGPLPDAPAPPETTDAPVSEGVLGLGGQEPAGAVAQEDASTPEAAVSADPAAADAEPGTP